MSNLELKYVSWQYAKYACSKWYYRSEMPRGKYVAIGVFEDDVYCGVILFGPGACDALGRRWNLKTREVCEMTRMALGEHESNTSKILGVALRLLHKKCPGIRVVISFCDPESGHIGTIYQATNWLYTGTTAKDAFYETIDGKKYHSRAVSESGYKGRFGRRTSCPKPSECKKIVTQGKHRYVYCFDDEIKGIIKSIEYPKRAESIENDASCIPAGTGRCDSDLGAPLS